MSHFALDHFMLERVVRIAVIGAGGTGSQFINGLVKLHMALSAFGHPGGLQVTLVDDDLVSDANIGRQAFFPCDVGNHKASTLINRINLAFGLNWHSVIDRITEQSSLNNVDMAIGCVDNRGARKAILAACKESAVRYWIDCGNRLSDAQVILGHVSPESRRSQSEYLANAADLFPDLIDESLDDKDDTPSCSLADALEKQSLFINSAVALFGCNMLFEWFRSGYLSYHGAFVNLKTCRTSPLPASRETWKRFGFEIPVVQPEPVIES